MTTSTLTFDIVPSNPSSPVGAEVWVDQLCILNQDQLTESCVIKHEFNDAIEQSYVVKIVLKNKTSNQTQIDADGNIVSDSILEIKNFDINGINIDQVVREQAVYCHNFNGSGSETTDQFYNTVGCNGTITLNLITPVYLWLLENM